MGWVDLDGLVPDEEQPRSDNTGPNPIAVLVERVLVDSIGGDGVIWGTGREGHWRDCLDLPWRHCGGVLGAICVRLTCAAVSGDIDDDPTSYDGIPDDVTMADAIVRVCRRAWGAAGEAAALHFISWDPER